MTKTIGVTGVARTVTEWIFESSRTYSDPFNELDIDVIIESESGERWRVPAFWSGGSTWRVRFAAPEEGLYRYTTECLLADGSFNDDPDLQNVQGELQVGPLTAEASNGNPLLVHGPLRVSEDRRHLVFADNTPFFWLGDTWWMGLTGRMSLDMAQAIVADRVAKGFTVIQLVAGLYPDMEWNDPRGANEAGQPYDAELTEVNPAYFDVADEKIDLLVQSGLMPCIVGSWGYYLNWFGIEKIRKHWRYMVARWSAYPVVWCLAGEATYAYHESTDWDGDAAAQLEGWSEIGRYLRSLDPMRRLITIHPKDCGRDDLSDDSVLDFEMLQTYHMDHESIPVTAKAMWKCVRRTPPMPVIDGEVNYEGIMGGAYDNVQRAAFWICMLTGAAGHTYGANGIWQVNERGRPYGQSSHNTNWGSRPWDEAMRLPGSAQLGLGKSVLERYDWQAFQPRQDWVSPTADDENCWANYAAGIPGQVRFIYLPKPIFWGQFVYVRELEPGVHYSAKLVDPSSGAEHLLGDVEPDSENRWRLPTLPEMRDWLLILEV